MPTLTLTLKLTQMLTLKLTQMLTLTLNLTPKRKLCNVLKKVKKKVDKVRGELKNNGIPDMKHNRSQGQP